MGRPKKEVENTNEISIKEVWDVLSFAQNLVNIFPGAMNPMLVNQRMQELSFNPLMPTEETLRKALENPKGSEEQLRSFTESLELVSMPFKRILAYQSSMLGLDVTYTCINPDVKYDDNYTKSQNIVWDYLDRFDYHNEFRKVIKQLLRNELVVVSPRGDEDGDKIILQELPIQRCKIDGKWGGGFVISFDLLYFYDVGVDIRLFHPFFAKAFHDMFWNVQTQTYDPSLPVQERGQSKYVYYVDVPPDIAWAFKFDSSLVNSVPYYASLMPDFVNQGQIRNLQKNLYISSASKLLLGAVPLLKDTKAKLADMISIDPTTLGKFLALVKAGLASSVGVAAAPLEDMQSVSFDSQPIYAEYLDTAVDASGVNAPMVFSGKLKANAIESQISFESDSLLMQQSLHPQFNSFLNYFINKKTKKYKFDFQFEGNAYYLNRKQRLDAATSLAGLGMFMPQKFAAALGMKPQNFIRMMQENKQMDYSDLLTPIIASAQMSAGGSGRPSKDDSELSDSGQQTRSDASNIEKGGRSSPLSKGKGGKNK